MYLQKNNRSPFYQVIYLKDGKYTSKSTGKKNKSEALKYLSEFEKHLEEDRKPKDVYLSQFREEYEDFCKTKAKSYQRSIRLSFNQFCKFLEKDYKLTELNVIDGLPRGMRMVAGQRDYEGEELGPGEEITAYSYVAKMSRDMGEKFEVTHTFNALDPDGEKVIFEMPVEIDLASDDIPTEPPEEEKGEMNETAEEEKETAEEAEEEKKGFFGRIWAWIKGLF